MYYISFQVSYVLIIDIGIIHSNYSYTENLHFSGVEPGLYWWQSNAIPARHIGYMVSY
jgi:hypothetical protein